MKNLNSKAKKFWVTFIGLTSMVTSQVHAVTYIDNDGVANLSSAVTTLMSNAYSIANQLIPVAIAVLVCMAIYRLFKRFGKA